MATNFYFSQKVRSEQQLYEDLVIESLRMYGQDVYYLPRDIVNEDKIGLSSHQNQWTFPRNKTRDGVTVIFTKRRIQVGYLIKI